jgi:hypothetical protein
MLACFLSVGFFLSCFCGRRPIVNNELESLDETMASSDGKWRRPLPISRTPVVFFSSCRLKSQHLSLPCYSRSKMSPCSPTRVLLWRQDFLPMSNLNVSLLFCMVQEHLLGARIFPSQFLKSVYVLNPLFSGIFFLFLIFNFLDLYTK